MAERRMFAKTIIDSDAFLDMPATARLLYYDLAMRADDDGFVNSPKKIMRMIGATKDDLSILILRKFVIVFDNSVVVITHWRIHNYVRKDRYIPTQYQEQLAMLTVNPTGAYTDEAQKTPCIGVFDDPATVGQPNGNQMTTVGQPNGNQWLTQDRLGKDRLGKDRLGKDIYADADASAPACDAQQRKKYGEYANVLLSDADITKLQTEYPDWQDRIEQLSAYMASTGKSYKSHLATICNWAARDKRKQTQGSKQQSSIDYGELQKLKNRF